MLYERLSVVPLQGGHRNGGENSGIMIEALDILGIGAFVAFWVSAFLLAFYVSSNKFGIYMLAEICLVIGWIIVACLWHLEWNRGIPDWAGFVFIILFFVSSLCSGYFCGGKLERKEKTKR